MAINDRLAAADSPSVSTPTARLRARLAGDVDAGFSMIEIVFALLIIAVVTTASLGFFINNLRSVNGQSQRQQAVNLANQQLETVKGLPINQLVKGRTKSSVTALWASAAAARLKISSQDDVTSTADYDPTATASSTPTVLPSQTLTVSGVPYTISTFIDTCWYDVSTGICGSTSSAKTTQEYRASVDVSWHSNGQCTTGCDYSTSTLIDPSADPQFNNNISTPSGNIVQVGTDTHPPAVPNIINDNGGSCTVNGNTYTGTKIVIAGDQLKFGVRVVISAGGGVIPAGSVYQPIANEIDFCLQTYDAPGPYTLSVINVDGGHFQPQINEIPNLSSAGGWDPAGRTLTLTGSGFEQGATVTVSGGGASMSGTTNLDYGNLDADTVDVKNFVGPKDGGSTIVTITNPDATSATYTVTAPNVTSYAPTAIAAGVTKTVNLAGTGFGSGMTAVAVSGGTVGSVTVSNSTAASFPATPARANTPLQVYLYNVNGGITSTGSIISDPLPTITSFTPAEVTKSTTSGTITVRGTGFQAGMTISASNGSVSSYSLNTSSQQFTFKLNPTAAGSDAITVVNPDGGSVTFVIVVPAVTSFSPTSIKHSTAYTWTVNGSGFESGATISFKEGSSTLSVSSTTFVDSTTMTFRATASSTTRASTFSITVTNPDGSIATYSQNIDPT